MNIIYDLKNMICTDPATLKFGKEVSDGCWYYLQVRADSVLCKYEDNPKGFVEAYYNDDDVRRIIDSHTGVYAGEIDLADYTDEEIEDHINAYGYTLNGDSSNFIQNTYGDSWKQICCECIFEQLMLSDFRLDY